MKVSADVRAMIERRKKGHTLEAPFYASEEVHALDMDAIFRRHWIQVAVEPDVPEAGDYMTVELGNDSILIVRDDDMQIRAFHNVCRHRGARLCSSEKGSLGNIVCPYHSWTYNLNGDLMFAEHMGEQFDKCKHSLKKVHLENLAGLIFVCLAETSPYCALRWNRTCCRTVWPTARSPPPSTSSKRATGSSRWRTIASAITASRTIRN
jgi:Rieske 2Fe-2S family protein